MRACGPGITSTSMPMASASSSLCVTETMSAMALRTRHSSTVVSLKCFSIECAVVVLGAGWQSPPAVKRERSRAARERLPGHRKGQQTRCDSEADGHSPDGRERNLTQGLHPEACAFGAVCPDHDVEGHMD